MDFLPFEIYTAPFPRDEFGLVFEIAEYCTEDELKKVSEIIKEKTHLITPDVYPNQVFHLPFITQKTQLIYDHRDEIFDYMIHTFNTRYAFQRLWDENERSLVKYNVREVLQASPKGMGEYPIHNDGGKSMTILVPLSPLESVSTRFHGWHEKWKNELGCDYPYRTIPWKVNHAYLFCPSKYTWHSYCGDDQANRWIYNINLFDEDM